jgi:hypothetical protein
VDPVNPKLDLFQGVGESSLRSVRTTQLARPQIQRSRIDTRDELRASVFEGVGGGEEG